MKAALVLLLASGAAAGTVNCQIPATYVATGCTAATAPYRVYGVCITGADPVAYGLTAANQIREEISATNANAFIGTGPNTATGCVVPSFVNSWNTMGPLTTVAPLNTNAASTLCSPIISPGGFSPTLAPLKGVEVRCNREAGYLPVTGFEGTALCGSPLGGGPYPATPATTTSDYFFSNAYQAVNYGLTTTATRNALIGATEFTGENALTCARACTLPTSICTNGQINGNIFLGGSGFSTTDCTLSPNRVGVTPTGITFFCVSALGATSTVPFTVACAAGGAAATTTYNGQCGSADSASSPPLWNFNGRLNRWASTITQGVNQIFGYPAVTSTLTLAYAARAYATTREWNNNGAQALRDGAVYTITITGCSALTGNDRIQCVQRTLNWWRCFYDFPFEGGTICLAGGQVIACPVPELGFNCPSSSKKGLLGLLGLLGLIPLFLICCCLLFLCCIRRKKTEHDVHFATFDPHAAPVMGTAHCAPMTACAGSFAPATMPIM